MTGTKTASKNLLTRIHKNPRYSGKHIIVIDGKVYATKTGQGSSKLLEKLLKKYPKKTPIVTYIPKTDSLILVSL